MAKIPLETELTRISEVVALDLAINQKYQLSQQELEFLLCLMAVNQEKKFYNLSIPNKKSASGDYLISLMKEKRDELKLRNLTLNTQKGREDYYPKVLDKLLHNRKLLERKTNLERKSSEGLYRLELIKEFENDIFFPKKETLTMHFYFGLLNSLEKDSRLSREEKLKVINNMIKTETNFDNVPFNKFGTFARLIIAKSNNDYTFLQKVLDNFEDIRYFTTYVTVNLLTIFSPEHAGKIIKSGLELEKQKYQNNKLKEVKKD
jgi:hypothetical protein